MAILSEIRKRPFLLMGIIAVALLAFVVNPESIDKFFGKDPNILGKVNGEQITREEFFDQLTTLQQQAEAQGTPAVGLEEQAWNILVQSKLIKQEFEKLGMELTEEMFWNQIQYDPMFANAPNLFDEKGNFKTKELQKEIQDLKDSSPENYNAWLKQKKNIEYRIMARQLLTNTSQGITTNKKEAEVIAKYRDLIADIEYVKVDYASFLQKNPIKVTTQDLADYIKKHSVTFKTAPSRNLGIVYFPAKASASDENKIKTEIETLLNVKSEAMNNNENFRNTTNDSLFIAMNSDMPFNPNYVPAEQLPRSLNAQLPTAQNGQIFGPYKEGDLMIVSKLLNKKEMANSSTLARHILISFKGNQAGENETRTEEQAKKLADSIGNIVKANPSKFTEFINLSADKGSAANGGSLGWASSSQPQFVPEFQAFVDNSPKGATGVVKTTFGYHIINIEDKKTDAPKMTYKMAHLVKVLKPSEETENQIDKNSRRFIQQVVGKSFNEFSNIAKKSNYNFLNPKSLKRFEGSIPGVGTSKDAEILSWAFDKKREKGDTEIFSVEGTGDKIVVYLNDMYDDELANPESVRDQIEPIVKNQLAAKKIKEKAKGSTLDAIASQFGQTKNSAQINMVNPLLAGSMEPKVAGASFGVAKSKLSNAIEGFSGVYWVVKKSESINKQPGSIEQVIESLSMQNAQIYNQSLFRSLYDKANIEDYRTEVWNKTQQ